jgi:RNA polymerase sigma-70 factor (ECF subfamily)
MAAGWHAGLVQGLDASTVRRAQRGDTRALDSVVGELMPYVGRICGAIALQAGDDALQEAMMAIVKNLDSLREPDAIRSWARRIAVRSAVRVVAAGRDIPMEPAVLANLPAIADDATAVEVHAVLSSLPPEHRAVLVLRHLDGLKEDEMADALGVAAGTVKSRLHRARHAFRARWT